MPVDEQFLTFRDAVRGLVRHRWWAIFVFLTIVVAVVIATLLTPKKYSSEAKLLVKLGRENTRLDATAALGQGPVVAAPQSREGEVNSVAQVIGCQSILEKVVDSIGAMLILDTLDRPTGSELPNVETDEVAPAGSKWDRSFRIFNNVSEREKAVIKLRENLKVEPIDKSNIVTVEYEAYSPKLAQKVVQEVVDFYLGVHVRINRTPKALQFLQDQIASARQELEITEQKLRRLNSETGITDPDVQRGVLLQRIARLEDSLLELQASEQAAEAEVNQLVASLADLDETTVMEQTTGAGNPAIDTMRGKLFELQIMREHLLALFTENHIRVKQINKQIRNTQEILAGEETKRTQQTHGPNNTFEEARIELIKKRPVLAALQVKRAMIKKQLSEVRSQLETFNTNALRVVAMERDVAVKRDNYHKYAHNLEQARIDNSLETEQISNITIAQPPTYNEKPVRPRKLLNLVIGIVVGLLGGVSCAVSKEYFEPTIGNDPEVPRMAAPDPWASPPQLVHREAKASESAHQFSRSD